MPDLRTERFALLEIIARQRNDALEFGIFGKGAELRCRLVLENACKAPILVRMRS